MTARRLICLMLLLFLSPLSALALEEAPYADVRGVFDVVENESRKVLVSFLGDCTIGCLNRDRDSERSIIHYVKTYGDAYPFEKVYPILSKDDLTVANLESVFADTERGVVKKTYNFRGDPAMVNVLKKGSVEAVTLANNHTQDYGEAGFLSTVKTLEDNDVAWFAHTRYSDTSLLYTSGNATIGLLGVHITYFWQNTAAIQKAIEDMKAQGASVVVAVIHGGVEYDIRHDKNQFKLARRLIQMGANAVVGHHPHTLQGFEIIEGAPVYYSLGNFVFGGNTQMRTDYTVILQMAFSFDAQGNYMGYQSNIIPCRLSADEKYNLYQPYPVVGQEALTAFAKIQLDTPKTFPLSPYIEGVGALQPYTPVIYETQNVENDENSAKSAP